jgi:putative Mg2+ transporter-C (MgtC) family protein
MLAALLGIIIGMERKSKGRSVGPKTGSLICLSSCVFTLVSSMFPGINADPTRVMAQIVSGIGFLGTAVIISKEGSKIGITSAATVWMTAAIGMVLGVKHYFLAVYLTSLYLFVTIIVGTIEHKLSEHSEKNKNK